VNFGVSYIHCEVDWRVKGLFIGNDRFLWISLQQASFDGFISLISSTARNIPVLFRMGCMLYDPKWVSFDQMGKFNAKKRLKFCKPSFIFKLQRTKTKRLFFQ
jgi:hypothetical protein